MAMEDLLQMILGGGGGGSAPPAPVVESAPEPVTPNLGLDAASYAPQQQSFPADFQGRIKELLERQMEDPAKYRQEQFGKTWMGKHPILGGITEFVAGLGRQESPTAKAMQQIDRDFATKKSLNGQILQTVLGEQRANQAAINADFAKNRDMLKNDLAMKGLDLKTAAQKFREEQTAIENAFKERVQAGKETKDLEDAYIKNQRLQQLIDNKASGLTEDQMRKMLFDQGKSVSQIPGLMKPKAGPKGMQPSHTIEYYPGTQIPKKVIERAPGLAPVEKKKESI